MGSTVTAASPAAAVCAQCGGRSNWWTDSDWGLLCQPCAFRQSEHDERRAAFEHLSPRTFGFAYDDE